MPFIQDTVEYIDVEV